MKINLGCGLKKLDGYVNVDYHANVNPDIILDLDKGYLPWEDNSVDEIVAHHILEHIGDNFLLLMQEIYRVCKDGAIIDIEVPHHRHENFFGDPTHKRPITVEMFRKFSKKYNDWHIRVYNSSMGFGKSLDVDFEILEYDFIIDGMYDDMVKEGKFQEIHELSKRFINVYSDLKIKLVVIKDGN